MKRTGNSTRDSTLALREGERARAGECDSCVRQLCVTSCHVCNNYNIVSLIRCSFGAKHVTPRSLSARNIGNLVCCEGIVTKCEPRPSSVDDSFPLFHAWLLRMGMSRHTYCTCVDARSSLPLSFSSSGSLVRPKVVKSVHYCPATGKTIERKYADLTSLEPFPTSSVYPTRVTSSVSLWQCI